LSTTNPESALFANGMLILTFISLMVAIANTDDEANCSKALQWVHNIEGFQYFTGNGSRFNIQSVSENQ
jgi:hypothetical protein